MNGARIEEDNRYLVELQRRFRMAADVVATTFATFPEVRAVAVIGSVAKRLWKEVPRFSPYRHRNVELWHECRDLDLAVWIDSQAHLGELRRARDLALRAEYKAHADTGRGVMGVVGHQVDVFLFEPETDRYLGRLCSYNRCPKGKRDCAVPGCGEILFNKRIADFEPHSDLLEPARYAMLYERGRGRLRSALDLPSVNRETARSET